MSLEILLASAARTATTTSNPLKTISHEAANITFDVSAVTGTPSLTLSIESYDRASGNWTQIVEGNAVSTVSTTVYKIAPLLTAAANSIIKDYLPSVIRVVVTHGTADSVTYSVGVDLLA